MPLKSYSTSIDFSHYNGIAYVSDHPTWHSYEETDYNFLRAMGYSLTIDQPKYVYIADIEVTPESVDLSFDSLIGISYQAEMSTDLLVWDSLTEEIIGTGSQVVHGITTNNTFEPKMFFRIKQIEP